MGLKGKLIAQVNMKSSGHHIHDLYSAKPHHVPKVCPAHIQSFQLQDGELGEPGSIVFWNYIVGGKVCIAKGLIESNEKTSKTISFKIIEGDLLNDYKNFAFHIHTTAEEVKWVLEYEKIRDDGPHPIDHLNLALGVSENIDNHHLKS